MARLQFSECTSMGHRFAREARGIAGVPDHPDVGTGLAHHLAEGVIHVLRGYALGVGDLRELVQLVPGLAGGGGEAGGVTVSGKGVTEPPGLEGLVTRIMALVASLNLHACGCRDVF